MSGCCEHCLPNCQEIAYPDEHEGPESHSWRDGNCHACQERERIMAELNQRAQSVIADKPEGWQWVGPALLSAAADIATGVGV